MLILQHWLDLFFLFVILLSPIPLCLSLVLQCESEENQYNLPRSLLLVLTSWCVIEASLGIFLGIIQFFTLWAVLLSESIIFICGISLLWYIHRRIPSFRWQKLLIPPVKLNTHEKLLIGTLGFVGILILWTIASQPITNYDSLWYHLPIMARWQQTSSLTIDILNDSVFPIPYYPYTWEVLCSLFLMPFREDFLVAFPNFIAWLILGLSVYLLSIQFGASRFSSIVSSSIILTVPLLLSHVNTMHVDLPFAAFFIVSLYLAIIYCRTQRFAYLALFIVTVGMLIGIKTSGIIYGLFLIAIFAVLLLKNRINGKLLFPVGKSYKYLSLLFGTTVFCFLLLGCFWYIRNFIDIGNPLGNIKVKIANFTILPGTLDTNEIRKTTLANLFKLTNITHWKILATQIKSLLQVQFVLLVLQFILFLCLLILPTGFVRRGTKISHVNLIGIIALVIGTGFLYWTTPYGADNGFYQGQITAFIGQGFRYAFPFLSLLSVVGAVGATSFVSRYKNIVVIVLILTIIDSLKALISLGGLQFYETSFSIKNYFIYSNILLLCWLGYQIIDKSNLIEKIRKKFNNISHRLIVSGLILLLFFSTFLAREVRDVERGKLYGGILEYIQNNIRKDEILGYLLSDQTYVFYGKNFHSKLVHIPSKLNDSLKWLNDLENRGVSVVAVGPLTKEMQGREISWLENPNWRFIRVFGQDPHKESVLYRLKSN